MGNPCPPHTSAPATPRLSVIVPAYGVEQSLDRCMESILRQGGDLDMEVILIDDGSTDATPALCDAWAAAEPRVRTVHQPNGGLSAARNTGLRLARGEYVTFVDSDDALAPGTYRRLLAVLAVHPEYDLLEYPVDYVGRRGGPRTLDLPAREYRRAADYWLGARAYLHTYAWNKIFRRSLFLGVTFPEGRVFEDAATLPLLLRRAAVMATTPEGRYLYRWNPGGITARAGAAELRQLLDAHLAVLPSLDLRTAPARRYYLHVADIQLCVSILGGDRPRLRRLWLPLHEFRGRRLAKALLLDLLGLRLTARLLRLAGTCRKRAPKD